MARRNLAQIRRGSIEGNTPQGIFLLDRSLFSESLDEEREIGDNRELPKISALMCQETE